MTMTTKENIQQWAAQNEITIDSEFVPFSKSRNAGEKNPSLNWKVTLKKAGHKVLTIDYTAGMAHCPSYKQGFMSMYDKETLDYELEHGKKAKHLAFTIKGEDPILPDLCDVLYSLSLDSEALYMSGFEEWAENMGYDTDSRKAEAIYKTCLDIALRLNQYINLAELREIVREY